MGLDVFVGDTGTCPIVVVVVVAEVEVGGGGGGGLEGFMIVDSLSLSLFFPLNTVSFLSLLEFTCR